MKITLSGWRDNPVSLNNVAPAHMLRLNEMAIMSNMRWDGGSIVKRGGTVAYGSATGSYKVMGLWIGYRSDGTTTPIKLRFENGLFEYNTGAGWTSTTLSGWSTSIYPTVVCYQNAFWICNGSNTPQTIPFSALTTPATWTMPTDFNPSVAVVYMNKIWAWGDTSTPNRIHFCDFGSPQVWQEQNFYVFPDSQNGGHPIAGVVTSDAILLYGEDVAGTLTGASELDNAIRPWPRRSALISRRSVIDMGGAGASLTPEGFEIADGFSQPRSLDPERVINWGDANLDDLNYCWGVRTGPYTFRQYFRSRGMQTLTGSNTVTVGSLVSSIVTRVWSFLTRVPAASAPTLPSHYYQYDMVARSWSGPHTGAHTCGVWETTAHGDRQFIILGDAANGKTYKGDQDVYTDDGTNIKCILRTNSFGLDPFKTYKVNSVQVLCTTVPSMLKMRVYTDGQVTTYKCEVEGSMAQIAGYDDTQSTSDELGADRGMYCVLTFPLMDRDVIGRNPQVELIEESDKNFVVQAISIDVSEEK